MQGIWNAKFLCMLLKQAEHKIHWILLFNSVKNKLGTYNQHKYMKNRIMCILLCKPDLILFAHFIYFHNNFNFVFVKQKLHWLAPFVNKIGLCSSLTRMIFEVDKNANVNEILSSLIRFSLHVNELSLQYRLRWLVIFFWDAFRKQK